MKVCYIAGPFRGPSGWDIAENVRAAERLGLKVALLGGMPLIPHANSAHFHGQGSDEFWLEGTLELLRRCDCVVTSPDWRRSRGTRAEIIEARRRNMPIFLSGDLSMHQHIVQVTPLFGDAEQTVLLDLAVGTRNFKEWLQT